MNVKRNVSFLYRATLIAIQRIKMYISLDEEKMLYSLLSISKNKRLLVQ